MGARKTNLYQQKNKVDTIFDLIEEGVADDLLAHGDSTEIAFLDDFADEAKEFIENQGKYMGVSTGYEGVDTLLGSFLPGELLTIGGDTGHGKSLFAANVAQNVYDKYTQSVLLVNLELTRVQAYMRFYSISGAKHDFSGIMVQKSSAVKYSDIDILMQKAKEYDCALVIIDHLHFFSRSADNQAQELSRIMKHFKEAAVQNNLPVMLLSHVTPTRIMDSEGNVKKVHKPGLHNFKGSSSIEQDSDMVGFVFRNDDTPNDVEFYMRKNRSRELKRESTYLKQHEWKLEEDQSWVPQSLNLN